jgi:hypothetical protein
MQLPLNVLASMSAKPDTGSFAHDYSAQNLLNLNNQQSRMMYVFRLCLSISRGWWGAGEGLGVDMMYILCFCVHFLELAMLCFGRNPGIAPQKIGILSFIFSRKNILSIYLSVCLHCLLRFYLCS